MSANAILLRVWPRRRLHIVPGTAGDDLEEALERACAAGDVEALSERSAAIPPFAYDLPCWRGYLLVRSK